MKSPARRLPTWVCLGLALLLLACLALGFVAQQKSSQLRADLADQLAIGQQLGALETLAEQEGAASLQEASSQTLGLLSPAARQLSQEEPLSLAASLPDQLEASSQALLSLGLEAQDPQDRALAFWGLLDLWKAAQLEGLTDQPYPPALAEQKKLLTDYSCQQPAQALEGAEQASGQGENPFGNLQDQLHQLSYRSSYYLARADQGYGQVQDQARATLQKAESAWFLATPLLSCQGLLLGQAPAYSLVPADQASPTLSSSEQALAQTSRDLLGASSLPLEEQDLEALALLLAFDLSA